MSEWVSEWVSDRVPSDCLLSSWMLRNIHEQKGSLMVMSDPLSRAYLDEPPTQTEFCNELEEIVLVEDLPISEAQLKEFKEGTASDDILQILMSAVLEGWPKTLDEVPAEVKPYFQVRDEITAHNGLLFKGERLIVPAKLRKEMMEKIHLSHLGIEGCLRRAREVFYWPRLKELKDFILKCDICNLYKPAQPREPLMPHEIPSRPWQKVGTDLFLFDQRQYLITADYYSSFFEVDKLNVTDSRTVIEKLKMQFSRHGIPEIVISDNGPQYASAEFAKFASDWHFQHITSSPRNPPSNGKVESAVKICENIMRKALHGKFDPYLALLDYHNTPTDIGSSPAQRLFSRRTRNLLPLSSKQLEPKSLPPQDVQDKLINSKQKQAFYYNLKGTALPELQPGQTVRMKRPKESTWKEAVCKKMIGPPVVVSGGRTYRRNRRQLRSVPQSDFHPVAKPVLSLYNQYNKQTPHLLWNLLLNMWKLHLLQLLQGVVVLSKHQPVFRTLRLRLYTLLETLFWTWFFLFARKLSCNLQGSVKTLFTKGKMLWYCIN